jgi:hypothetical protein
LAEEPMVYMRLTEVRGEKVLAVCDEQLLGAKLVDTELNIVFHVNEKFYGGELVPLSYAIMKAEEATIINLVGEKAVEAAVRAGLVHPEAVIRIAGVPHAQAVKMMPY